MSDVDSHVLYTARAKSVAAENDAKDPPTKPHQWRRVIQGVEQIAHEWICDGFRSPQHEQLNDFLQTEVECHVHEM